VIHKKLDPRYGQFLNQRVDWAVGIPEKFSNMSVEEIKTYLGTILEDYSEHNITMVDYSALTEAQNLPNYFNAYETWPKCTHPIRDQGQCGSCWAFGASETLTDRLCIASKGTTNVILSPQYLVSCSDLNLGCHGGILRLAWLFMGYHGLSPDTCVPYISGNGTSESCPSTCEDGTPIDLFKAKLLSIKTFANPTSIKYEIMKNGPIETGFMVYQDFMYYAGGIYKHTNGALLGGHAVKIIGWGEENGTEYWICANSWGVSWGEQGFFRIAQGECGIDSNGIAGVPSI